MAKVQRKNSIPHGRKSMSTQNPSPMPSPNTSPTGGNWAFLSLAAFGCALGLLTALNTTSGLTATLIGLLFAFIGASVLSWFKPDVLTDANRLTAVRYIGSVSVGLLFGLFTGFACRIVDEGFLQPWLMEKRDKPTADLKRELKAIQEQFNAAKERSPSSEELKRIEKSLDRVERILEKREGQIVSKPVTNVFQVQKAAAASAAEVVQRELARDQKRRDAKEPSKLSDQDRMNLESLQQALLKDNPQDHLTSDLVGRVRDMVMGGRLSTEAKDAITDVVKW